MRIATCNLERLGRGRSQTHVYDAELEALNADLIIVTEPGQGFRDRNPLSRVSSQDRARDEAWVAMVGPTLAPVVLDIPYRRLALASRSKIDDTSIVIYGSILPWLSARAQAPDVYGEQPRSFVEIFETALEEQVVDMLALRSAYPDDCLIWAGDFNHTLVGHALSNAASTMLKGAIARLGLKAVNAHAPHRSPGWHAIDLICVEQAWTCSSVESPYPLLKGRALSDHRWYIAEVQP
jgi:hypothetical protein